MTLVEKIKMLAKSRGITISALESTLGIPASDKILKVANFFGTTTDYLLRKELENPISPSDMEQMPVTYYHLLNGARDLDLTKQDVDFILDVAKRYKMLEEEKGRK